ncbi:hypothetical protein FQZ97_861160 [compost metagenome]
MQPLLQAFDQFRAVWVEDLVGQRVAAEQVQGALVGQQHPMLGIENQDAGAHPLQDQGVQRFQVGHVGCALFGQAFADVQAPRHPLHE